MRLGSDHVVAHRHMVGGSGVVEIILFNWIRGKVLVENNFV